ncbi:hypothetical protein NM208_g3892 [Fusarium decemcellulare]|uniref:Uncharacterized protein n=1 Tax=Fusarium decemcellulare TaxID=57161 RepID=A0ACC1SML5_9HYPO|nr:hypothetical protein NM208_g3892 [Fusarium decemcellulare]
MSLRTQTAVLQCAAAASDAGLPIAISCSAPRVTDLPSPHHVLVRVQAVGLNPVDHKMITHFFMDGYPTGCDFCGIVESAGSCAAVSVGDRVCGGEFPYHPDNPNNGAFAQWKVADSRQLLVLPAGWDEVDGAAVGGISWGTVAMAASDPEALGLTGVPSKPVEKPVFILVYGGGTVTAKMVMQIFKLSGYSPIAVCSPASAPLALEYGAVGTASYTSANCVETILSIAGGVPIKYALDCITDADSAAICFGALSRAGGRYVCLERFDERWRTRRAVKVKEVMGFEMQGIDVDLGDPVYSRSADPARKADCVRWAKEVQSLLNEGLLRPPPIHEVEQGWEGILDGLAMLQRGQVKGQKLVVRIPA